MSNTVDFLFELGTEELPPVSLKRLSDAFISEFEVLLKDSKLGFTEITPYATPRRLALLVNNLDMKQADLMQTRLGPAVAAAFDSDGNPTKAAEGFARSCGVTVSDLQQIETDKGPRLGIELTEQGKDAKELLPDLVSKALQKLPIPKAMRWGNRNDSFVRPVKWIVALFGDEVVPMEMFGCKSGRITRGHRFMGAGQVEISSPEKYSELLTSVYVQASQSERMTTITKQVQELANEHSLHAVIDDDLLEEVSALVEWPVALMGSFEESFLSVPQEALISTMSKNQKYFHLLDNEDKLAARFITIANLESHKPDSIIIGNEKVIRPRLADAEFFYQQDCKHSLTSQAQQLNKIVFQKELGTVADKCLRITTIATELAEILAWDTALVQSAGPISKADLVTEMVKEFPSLQGIMGKYYAQVQGLDSEVASSLEEIYLPRHAGDKLPHTKTGILLALADRLDSLAGIFSINQVPTGNKDPFALRRASLGVIRIILEHRLALSLKEIIELSLKLFENNSAQIKDNLLEFFTSRMRAMYLEQGVSAQVFMAVEQTEVDSLIDFDLRVEAVKGFNSQPEAESLAAANKRVANILSKNPPSSNDHGVSESLLTDNAEQELYKTLLTIESEVFELSKAQDYAAALKVASQLKDPLDLFFDEVMVMAEDDATKTNRLSLLLQVRKLFLSVADISYLQI